MNQMDAIIMIRTRVPAHYLLLPAALDGIVSVDVFGHVQRSIMVVRVAAVWIRHSFRLPILCFVDSINIIPAATEFSLGMGRRGREESNGWLEINLN